MSQILGWIFTQRSEEEESASSSSWQSSEEAKHDQASLASASLDSLGKQQDANANNQQQQQKAQVEADLKKPLDETTRLNCMTSFLSYQYNEPFRIDTNRDKIICDATRVLVTYDGKSYPHEFIRALATSLKIIAEEAESSQAPAARQLHLELLYQILNDESFEKDGINAEIDDRVLSIAQLDAKPQPEETLARTIAQLRKRISERNEPEHKIPLLKSLVAILIENKQWDEQFFGELLVLMQLLVSTGEHQTAADTYDMVDEAVRNDHPVHMELRATIETSIGNTAGKRFEAAGRVFDQKNQEEDAKRCFEEALDNNNSLEYPLEWLGRYAVKKQDDAELKSLVERYKQRGNMVKAIELQRAAWELKKEDAEVFGQLYALCFQESDLENLDSLTDDDEAVLPHMKKILKILARNQLQMAADARALKEESHASMMSFAAFGGHGDQDVLMQDFGGAGRVLQTASPTQSPQLPARSQLSGQTRSSSERKRTRDSTASSTAHRDAGSSSMEHSAKKPRHEQALKRPTEPQGQPVIVLDDDDVEQYG